MTKSEPACPAATSRYATGCASLSLSPNGPFAMRNVQTITEGQCKKRLFSLQWISASGFQLEPVYLRISVWEPKTLSLSRQMHACFGKVNGCVNQRLGPNNSNNNISSQRPKRPNAIAKCHPLGSVQLYYRGLLPSLPTK